MEKRTWTARSRRTGRPQAVRMARGGRRRGDGAEPARTLWQFALLVAAVVAILLILQHGHALFGG